MVASKRLIAFSAAAAGITASCCCIGFISSSTAATATSDTTQPLSYCTKSLSQTNHQNNNNNNNDNLQHYEQANNNNNCSSDHQAKLAHNSIDQEHQQHLRQRQQLIINAPLSRLVLEEGSANLFARADQLEKSIDYYFNDIWQDSGDARTSKFPFIGTGPWKLLYATGLYLLMIKHLLPKLMYFKTNGGFELVWPLRFYNLAMVLANIYAFVHGARILNWGLYCFGCQLIDSKDKSDQTMELLHYGWLFLISRLIEWLDTVFFVLRKRERQITKLHIFHHSFVPLITWIYLKYHPSYTMAFFPFINSFVHSIMYSYYFLATFGDKIQPYLWWKRYLTTLQITQFVLILIQLTSIPLSANEKCTYPRGFLYFAFAGAILFLWLFYTYYIETYTKKQQPSHTRTQSKNCKQQQIREARLSSGVIQEKVCLKREGASEALCDLIENSIETSGR